jgi:hypothetical protein
MARQTATSRRQIAFPADWEWCPARVTYRPTWTRLGSTPGTLALSAARAYRITVRPETTPAHLSDVLRAAPAHHVRLIRIPHGGPIAAAGLGDVLAGLEGVESVGLEQAHDNTAWRANVRRSDGAGVQIELEGWPVDEAVAALGRVPKAARLEVNAGDFADGFSLAPLLGLEGLEVIEVHHRDHCEQELWWEGLSGQAALQKLEVRAGVLGEGFWREVGKLKRLQEMQLWWPRGARAAPGSLEGLASLKRVEAVCLFEHVPEAFRALAECPALEAIKIDQCKIDDASAAGIGSMARVKDCYVWNAEFSDAGMKALCRWPRIESLVLCENAHNPTPITEEGFTLLGDLETLESLHLQGFENVSAAGWSALGRMKRLKRLKLDSRPTFDLLEAVGPLASVEGLWLSHCNSVGPAGLRHLWGMPRLRTLSIRVHRYTPYHVPLAEVSEVRQLTALSLGSIERMTDADVGRLSGLHDLERLTIHEAPRITDRGVAGLAGLPHLRAVALHTVPRLTDAALATLAALPGLETLSLRCTGKMTEEGLAALGAARNLKTLHLDYARFLTGETLLGIVGSLPLEELAITSSPHLNDADLLALTRHPTLRRVEVSQCKRITAGGRDALAAARPDWGRPTFQFWQML